MISDTIVSQRLLLRGFKATDIDDYFEILKDPHNLTTAGQPVPESKRHANLMLRQAMQDQTLAVVLKSADKVIGLIEQRPHFEGRLPLPAPDQLEIGYILNQHYRRQGYMFEALSHLLRALAQQNFQAVWAAAFSDNLASRGLLEKLDFTYQQTVDLNLPFAGYQQKEDYFVCKIKS
ncbi:hypothetical protein FC83_GL000130 [Agrilactobacillus composti DSM 18527 = JCM 14202]|uniref:N-acetyltransferase domain-containing protein n=1 Tax=Agrilactobacillus composti DSM 18527 = JCM 14202 TaxID=1423734 RepID=X0QTT4_9LACO|nr:GNAT family N-acetyltransferase [Agrilactobacillus composti]KRM36097.1 hypothetical protein FC83_GL000130 [Agrilactobacillus composti DSM 18527 = JCM 14202]GAF41985.1 acetyltransferase, GNAT family [Agrilactobacillus composti DSM 18527 = JCM 14202]